MDNFEKPQDIKTVIEKNYIDYAASVIVSRAIPNFNDGLIK